MNKKEVNKKIRERFIEQYENINTKTILDLVEGIEEELNKSIWDFNLEELKSLMKQFNNKEEAKKVLGDYVSFAIRQGYTLHYNNNIKLFEDSL